MGQTNSLHFKFPKNICEWQYRLIIAALRMLGDCQDSGQLGLCSKTSPLCFPPTSLSYTPLINKLGVVVHVSNSSSWEVEAEGSKVEGHADFEASLSYLRPANK